jgi:hypothetical protein
MDLFEAMQAFKRQNPDVVRAIHVTHRYKKIMAAFRPQRTITITTASCATYRWCTTCRTIHRADQPCPKRETVQP